MNLFQLRGSFLEHINLDTYWETIIDDRYSDESTEDLQCSTEEGELSLQLNLNSYYTYGETNLDTRYSEESTTEDFQSSIREDELARQSDSRSGHIDREENLDHSNSDDSTEGNLQSSIDDYELALQFNLSSCVFDGVELAEIFIYLSGLFLGQSIMRAYSGLLFWIIENILGPTYMNDYPLLKFIPCVVFATGLMLSIIGIPVFTIPAYRQLKGSSGDYVKRCQPQARKLTMIGLIYIIMHVSIPEPGCSSENFCEMVFKFYDALLFLCRIILSFKASLLLMYPQLNART